MRKLSYAAGLTGTLLLRASSSASVLRKRKMLPRSASLRASSGWCPVFCCRPHVTCREYSVQGHGVLQPLC